MDRGSSEAGRPAGGVGLPSGAEPYDVFDGGLAWTTWGRSMEEVLQIVRHDLGRSPSVITRRGAFSGNEFIHVNGCDRDCPGDGSN